MVAYNGGGLDNRATTSNYPYRIWHQLKQMGLSGISYPPLSKIAYLLNGEVAPDGNVASFYSYEVSSDDDYLYPTPVSLGSSSIGGIRWTRGDFDVFQEITLHKSDGSIWP